MSEIEEVIQRLREVADEIEQRGYSPAWSAQRIRDALSDIPTAQGADL